MSRENEQEYIIDLLYRAWLLNDKQRLGQFLFNFLSEELNEVDLFMVTDKELLEALESKYGT